MPVKILLLGFCNGLGGGPTHFRILARFLADEGHAVLGLGITDDVSGLPEVPRPSRVIAIPYRAKTVFGRIRKALQFAGLATRIRGFAPDLFIAVGYGKSYPVFARITGRRAFKFYQDVWLAARDPVRDSMTAAFDAVAVQSPMMIPPFKEVMGSSRPVNWLPCFGDSDSQGHISTLPSPGEVVRLAYFGRLASNKGLPLLVDAVGNLPASIRATLNIYGDGPERDSLAEHIQGRNLGARVTLHGHYPGGDAYRKLLAGHHALVLPSTFGEGLPLVLLEAMSCGLPFVSTNVGAIPDAARGNPDAILVEPEARSIADGVRSLCERLVTGGFNPSRQREFFLKNFSNESFGERWRTMLADPEAFFRQ